MAAIDELASSLESAASLVHRIAAEKAHAAHHTELAERHAAKALELEAELAEHAETAKGLGDLVRANKPKPSAGKGPTDA